MSLIIKINENLLGPILMLLLLGTGLFLSVCTRFLQIRKFAFFNKKTIGSLFKKKHAQKTTSGVSPFQAVSTAMAGTIGTGSIAGIATAIECGGPGAVFWMWVSALLGMVTKYSEILLAVKFREKNDCGQWVGGPMYYIKNALGKKYLSSLFCIFTVCACLGMGNAVQSNSVSAALYSSLKISPWITASVLSVIMCFVILGGMRRISVVNERLVPFMALFYVTCSIAALVVNIKNVPEAFSLIFNEAFSLRAATSGAAGFGIMKAMHYGFSRGIFSNEAGLGSAPMAHAAADAKSPVEQGLWGMFEVFFTTIVICTMSALVILTAGLWQTGEHRATALCIASFDSAIRGSGSLAVTLSTVLFATSSLFGWAYYGEVATGFLTKNNKKAIDLYRALYVVIAFIGAVGKLELVWGISETMNTLMALPNLFALILLRRVIKETTKEYFDGKLSE